MLPAVRSGPVLSLLLVSCVTPNVPPPGDPPYLFSIVQYDGAELSLTELWSSNGYNSGEVTSDGGGMLKLRYDECPDAFCVTYTLAAGRLSAGQVITKRVHDPDECAACPHVYVLEAAGFAHKGEILRDLRRPELAAAQRLAFTRPQRFRAERGVITVEIREQEPETSFIDALALELDGRRILPIVCRAGEAAICSEDGRPAILRQGEVLSLEFEVGELTADSKLALWAVGYYVPTASP